MKPLIDYTKILRSKNAGPLFITYDLIFDSVENYNKIKNLLTKEMVSKAYDVPTEIIEFTYYDVVNSLKITFPRKNISGSLKDNDIYGCQQHMPLAGILIGD
jgi:hypothetical protein